MDLKNKSVSFLSKMKTEKKRKKGKQNKTKPSSLQSNPNSSPTFPWTFHKMEKHGTERQDLYSNASSATNHSVTQSSWLHFSGSQLLL